MRVATVRIGACLAPFLIECAHMTDVKSPDNYCAALISGKTSDKHLSFRSTTPREDEVNFRLEMVFRLRNIPLPHAAKPHFISVYTQPCSLKLFVLKNLPNHPLWDCTLISDLPTVVSGNL